MYFWSLTWRILSITLLACKISTMVRSFEHSLALPFFEVGIKTDIFHSCGHCWVFQICWFTECSTLTASSFRILSNSAGILLPPLTLFVTVLPKAYLISHSSMSGPRWVTTPWWFFRSLKPFWYSSFAYSCHLLIFFASVRSSVFLSFIRPIFTWNIPLSPVFLKRSLVFPFLYFSLFFCLFVLFFVFFFHCSRSLSHLSLLFSGTLHLVEYIFPFLTCLSLLFFHQLFVKPP